MICLIPPTSAKCSTVEWWHSNSIFSEARSPVFNLALKSPPLKDLKDSSASLKTFRVFQSRHLSLRIIADQPDCQSTHISGVFSSSPSTLSSGEIQNHICAAISPSFAFLPLLIYFPGPSSCTFIFSRSLFLYVDISQVPILVRWDRSFGGWESSSRAFQQHQAEWRYPHLCQGFHLSRSSKWCNGEKSNRSKQCGDFVFVFLIVNFTLVRRLCHPASQTNANNVLIFLIVNFTLVRRLYHPARRSFWELWRCQSEPP